MRPEQVAGQTSAPLGLLPSTTATRLAFQLEIELALLGACFKAPELIDAIAAIVEPDDFQEPINGRLFDAFLGRRLDGGKIDADMLTDLVADLLLDAEGAEFVESYVDAVVRPAVLPKFPRQFAIKIRAASKSRRGVHPR